MSFLRTAVVYFMLAVALGIYMSIIVGTGMVLFSINLWRTIPAAK